jgi:hypothetical protein
MESTLSSGGEPGQTNGLRYFGCWNVLAKPVF